jgi:hypothetical protein
MLRKVLIGALASLGMVLSTAAFAQAKFGTAAETKPMLEKAVAAKGGQGESTCDVQQW